MVGPDWERLFVDFLHFADDAVGVDGSHADQRAEQFFGDDHAVLQRAEGADVFLLLDGDAIEFIGQRIDDDVDVVKLGGDGAGLVQARVFAPHDMDDVVTDMALFVDLLRIV